MPEQIAINVAVSVLADISSGIYRTPANAIKELISNAFDADATRVVIHTGYPHFHTMTCSDNGKGMNTEKFQDIMDKIGGSTKRQGGHFTQKGRPIIGKIGIGILAVAQICSRFTIISSQEGEETKFEAHIDLKGLSSEKAKRIAMGTEEAMEIGSYDLFDDLPEDRTAHYTKIILEEIKPGFREKLLEASGPESRIREYKFREGDPKSPRGFVEWLATTDAREISDYNRVLWELGVICPVPYLDQGPVIGHEVIPDIKKILSDYDFSVEIDGLEIKKPILLPTSPEIRERGKDYEIYPLEYDEVEADRRLAFKGYIFHQRTSIRPAELRGLLVRIRDVAIGMYDKSLLNYPKAQGPRMTGISGEIYVEEGLENALNVDRNSFRETDPHYLKLQEVVYTRLGGDQETRTPGIFSDISRRSKRMSAEKKMRQETEDREELLTNLASLLGRPFQIESCDDDSAPPIQVDMHGGTILINEKHSIFPRAARDRRLIERMLIAFELASERTRSKNAVRRELLRLLSEF